MITFYVIIEITNRQRHNRSIKLIKSHVLIPNSIGYYSVSQYWVLFSIIQCMFYPRQAAICCWRVKKYESISHAIFRGQEFASKKMRKIVQIFCARFVFIANFLQKIRFIPCNNAELVFKAFL